MNNLKFILTTCILISTLSLSFVSNNSMMVQATSGSFLEDFSTTTYYDTENSNSTGWGTGTISNAKVNVVVLVCKL